MAVERSPLVVRRRQVRAFRSDRETMLKIIEQSADRLAFNMGIPFLNRSQCTLDRGTGRAIIRRTMFFWPRATIDVPLTDIASVQVRGVSNSVEGGNIETAIAQLTLTSGQQVNLSALAGDEKTAPKIVAAIKGFLGL